MRIALLLGILGVLLFPPAPAGASPPQRKRPSRIVSLDYCSDQFVLRLADRDRILAVSPDAGKSFSYMREAATGLPRVRPRAEDVVLLGPDLVVRAYGGGPNIGGFLARAGIEMAQVESAEDLDGVKRVLREMAEALGEPAKAVSIIADMEEREVALGRRPGTETVLYMTPSGVTTGPGTLVHEMLRAAGFLNFQREPGWRTLPLERLAYERPDRVAAAFFVGDMSHFEAWSAMRHPIARAQLRERPVTALSGAWTACGGWFLLDAVEALAGSE